MIPQEGSFRWFSGLGFRDSFEGFLLNVLGFLFEFLLGLGFRV